MYKVLVVIVFSVLFYSASLYSQVTSKYDTQNDAIDVEEFMGMLDGIFSDNLIDEMTYNLPDDISIYSYGIGDFTNDGYLDLAIAYKDNDCPKKTFKVILLIYINQIQDYIIIGRFLYILSIIGF